MARKLRQCGNCRYFVPDANSKVLGSCSTKNKYNHLQGAKRHHLAAYCQDWEEPDVTPPEEEHPTQLKKDLDPNEVRIYVQSGLVQEISRGSEMTQDRCKIRVVDYDIEGAFEDDLSRDSSGNRCSVSEW